MQFLLEHTIDEKNVKNKNRFDILKIKFNTAANNDLEEEQYDIS